MRIKGLGDIHGKGSTVETGRNLALNAWHFYSPPTVSKGGVENRDSEATQDIGGRYQ
jgi:hypothetical protein